MIIRAIASNQDQIHMDENIRKIKLLNNFRVWNFTAPELFNPKNPKQEDDYIEKRPENPFMSKIPVLWNPECYEWKAYNPEDIGHKHHKKSKWNIPEFVPPGTREKQEQHQNLIKLF